MYIPSPRSRPTGRESPAMVPTPVAPSPAPASALPPATSPAPALLPAPTLSPFLNPAPALAPAPAPAPAPIVTAPSLSTAAPDRGRGVCVAIPHPGYPVIFFSLFFFCSLVATHDPRPTFTPDRSAISIHGTHSGGTPRNSTGTSSGTGGISSSCHCGTGSRGRCVRDGPSPRGGPDSSGDNSSRI